MEQNEVTPEVVTEVVIKKDRFLPISILIAGVVIAGSVLFASLYRPGTTPTPAPAASGSGSTATLTAAQINTLGPRDAVLGMATAPVTVIEYGDYQCPFCGIFFTQAQSQIVQQYVNTGEIKLVFRNLSFLGPESTAAAEAEECAENQNKSWAYHDALYSAKVPDTAAHPTASENDGFFTRALFLQLAQKVGLDVPTFTSCIDTHKEAAQVTQDNTDGAAAGVNSTPTTFIDGQPIVEISGSSIGAGAGADSARVLQAIATAVAGK